MQRLSTQYRLVLLGIVVVLAIIGATALVLRMDRDGELADAQTAVSRVNYGMSRQTAHLLAPADQALLQLRAALAPNPGADAGPAGAALAARAVFDLLSGQLTRTPGVDTLFVVDAQGRIVNSSQHWPAGPVDVSKQDYFRHFKAADDPALFPGQPARDPLGGALDLPLARRIDDAHGHFAGVAVAEFSLAGLAEFYQLAMPPARTVYLARRDGIVVLGYPAPASEIGERIPAGSPWYAAVARGGGAYAGMQLFSPVPDLAMVRPLRGLPLVLQASGSEADALADFEHQTNLVILCGMFTVFCAVAILQAFGRQFDRIETSERSLAAKNAELDVAHRQLEATLANLTQGVCFFDENNRLLVSNRRYCELINLPAEKVRPGVSAAELAALRFKAGTACEESLEAYMESLAARVHKARPYDEIVQFSNGRTMSKHFEPLPGHGWVMTLEDITERRAAEMQIAYLAHHDLLTGLANRALFRDRLNQAFAEASSGKGFAMLCLDLDRFKAVNDTFGHPVGDGLLRAVADRLRAVVRASDTIARLGGDEFVILQLGVSGTTEPSVLASRIVQAINEPFVIDGHRLSIGVSIGIAMAAPSRMTSERLLQHADQALYRSKQGGRGTWRIYEPELESLDHQA